MTLSEIILAGAARMDAQGIAVHAVRIMGHVSIQRGNETLVFLQGDEGSSFLSQAEVLWNDAGTVTIRDVYLHLAEPYVEVLA